MSYRGEGHSVIEVGNNTNGICSERRQPRDNYISSCDDIDDDDTYRRRRKRQNDDRQHDDNYNNTDTYRKHQSYGRRDEDVSDGSQEFPETKACTIRNNIGRGQTSTAYLDHRKTGSPYRGRVYRTGLSTASDGRDSIYLQDHFSKLAGNETQRESPSKRYSDHSLSSSDDICPNKVNYSSDKRCDKSCSPPQRYEDPWNMPSNNSTRHPTRKQRKRARPHTSGDSLDSCSRKHSDRDSTIVPDTRNTTNSQKDRYENAQSKQLFSSQYKLHDMDIIGSPNRTKQVQSASIGEPQHGDQQVHMKGSLDKVSRKVNKQTNVDLTQETNRPVRTNSIVVSYQSGANSASTLQASNVSADQQVDARQDVDKLVYGHDENEERGNWSGKFDFILSMLGYAVGLGNVWRFPYLCYRNGGGAFLFPFLLMMAVIGLPVFYLEAALGQFTSCGAMTCWHFAPLFKGLGIAMVAVSGMTSIYYNIIIAWSLHYMFSSFTSDLPFASCHNNWNTENCKLRLPTMTCEGNAKAGDGRCLDASGKETGLWNKTLFTEVTGRTLQSPSQEYWERFVLNFSGGIDHYGLPKWDLVLCLLLAWIICFLCLIKGIKTTGKVVYFTALFPYVVLVVLLFRGITLENADIGIKYFITPDFERLADASVWKDAANQVFFSMSIAGGGLITLSSYNRFHNNILRDSVIVAVGDAGTCILGGFVIFSYLGYMAGQLQVDIEDVAADGAGLAFVVYPEAVSNLPPPTLWAILFFVMLLTLGLDSQFAMVETVLTGTLDQYPKCRPRKTFVILVICFLFFIFGLPLTCPGGMYLLQLMDNYVGGMTLIIIGLIEIIAIVFIYGINRFCQDIHIMTGSSRFLFWKVTWRVLSPLVITFIFIFMFVDYKPSKYDNYTYPTWADGLGWFMTIMCVLAIPGVMIFKICNEKEGKTVWQKLRLLCLPTVYWGPALKKHRILVNYVDGFQVDPYKNLASRLYFDNLGFDKTAETCKKPDGHFSLGASCNSIISTTSKSTAGTTKSAMTYESNV